MLVSESASQTHSAERRPEALSAAAGDSARCVPNVRPALWRSEAARPQKTLETGKIRLLCNNVVHLERSILGYDTAKCGRRLTTFRRPFLPAFSGSCCLLTVDRSCNASINCYHNIGLALHTTTLLTNKQHGLHKVAISMYNVTNVLCVLL